MIVNAAEQQVLRDALTEFIVIRTNGTMDANNVAPYVASRYDTHSLSFRSRKLETVRERVLIAQQLLETLS